MELAGTLDLQTFPGPPNYESIATGDEMERHFYLKLDVPVDVVPGKDDHVDNPELEKNVKIVQLAINGEDDALWARFHLTSLVLLSRSPSYLARQFHVVSSG